jgi:hypothetical protein
MTDEEKRARNAMYQRNRRANRKAEAALVAMGSPEHLAEKIQMDKVGSAIINRMRADHEASVKEKDAMIKELKIRMVEFYDAARDAIYHAELGDADSGRSIILGFSRSKTPYLSNTLRSLLAELVANGDLTEKGHTDINQFFKNPREGALIW